MISSEGIFLQGCRAAGAGKLVLEMSANLKKPETKERKFDDLVKSAECAAVLVLEGVSGRER